MVRHQSDISHRPKIKVPVMKDEIQRTATKYSGQIVDHENDIIDQVYDNRSDERRFRRIWILKVLLFLTYTVL